MHVTDAATAAANVVNWFLLVTAILAVLVRLGTKYFFVRRLTQDDYILCLALSISTSLGVSRQFHDPLDSLSASQLLRALKCEYASTLLFVASLCLSKLSASLFVRGLTPDSLDQNIAWVLGIVITVWGFVSEFVVAFQCRLPRPWDYIDNTCVNRTAWWNFFGVVNILTEAALVVQPVLIILPLRTSLTKKIGIIACFAGRIVVMVAIILQLVYLNRASHASHSLLESWQNVVCTEVVQCLSIVASCMPQFKPFLDSLQSSGMRLYDMPGSTKRYGYGSGDHRGQTSYKSTQASIGHRGGGGALHELIAVPQRLAHEATVTVTTGSKDRDWEVGSQSSQSRIIRETKTWTVAEWTGPPAGEGSRR
ncbi:hypothetical protein VTN77DRAFT_5669 [Rasamsonia byssochlamydoides]|uniref:uncharacterized protein n=1 Tax=Rasamsonia byssochlamydoides TaxID=89139 RepID=UPI003743ACE8